MNLIGACTLGGDLNVILEFCEHGSLLNHLRTKKDDFLPVWNNEDENGIGYSNLYNFAFQVSKGMEFLQSKKVFHTILVFMKVYLTCTKL